MGTPHDYNQRPWPQQPYPGPYQGQYPGQYQQPAPPGQWAQPAPSLPPKPKKSGSTGRTVLIIGAITAVLVLVIVVALLVVANQDTKKIAVDGVQREVQQILTDRVTGYSADDIKNVNCNNGRNPTVEKGGTFTCDVNVRGQQRQLTVTFQDNDGTYSVGLPQLVGGK